VSKIWSQSQARASLLGEESMNPSIAAKSLLVRRYGGKRVASAERFVQRYRRAFHRGNPVPALLATGLGQSVVSHIPGLKNLFKKHSEEIAAGLAPTIVAAANGGNLMAARGLIERAAIPMIAKEHQVWAAASRQLSAKIVGAVKTHASLIPQADQSGPAAFAASITSDVNLADLEAEAAAAAGATKAERARAVAQARADRQATIGTLSGVATAGLQALARRSLPPRRRPTRRRRY
jgi:hypothetical protein